MKTFLLFCFMAVAAASSAQGSYKDSMKTYRKNYISNHGVLKGGATKGLNFYEVNPSYRVLASFEKKENSPWFKMTTSGTMQPLYRVYGVVKFTINGKPVQLNVYQSQSLMTSPSYKNHLFLPFTDATSGKETYIGGRYLDLNMEEISGNRVWIDFNKAYNPYCAYVSGQYSCPIPPKENHLSIPLPAGEKAYAKH